MAVRHFFVLRRPASKLYAFWLRGRDERTDSDYEAAAAVPLKKVNKSVLTWFALVVGTP